jgi:hypothetical protein
VNILQLLTGHEHYWGVLHERQADKLLIQTCYGCGADRRVKADLQPSSSPEQPVSIAMRSSANNDARKAA